MMMKKTLTTTAILAVMLSSVVGQKQATHHTFSISQAVEYAYKNNVQVKSALLNIQSQIQTNREVAAAALPNITGGVGAQFLPNIAVTVIPDFISPATYGVLIKEGVKDGNGNAIQMPSSFGSVNAQFGTKYNSNASVSLRQILFDGQVFVGLQARNTAIDFQTKNAEVTEELIKSNIYKVYYQLVVSKTQLNLLDANIARIKKLESDATILFKNGFAERIDIDKASVQLNNLHTEKLKALNSINMGYLGLKTLMGMPIADTLILTDTLTYAQLKQDVTSDPYAYEDRKDYQYLSLAKKLNEYNIRRFQLSYLPTVALGASYTKQALRNSFDFFGSGPWFTASAIGVNISIPIFDGFTKDAQIKKARIDLQNTQNQIEALKINIDNAAEQARLKYQNAIATLEFQKKNMDLAEKVYTQTKKKYESGTGSNTEINAADVDLKAAQTNFISALYDAVIAKIDYLTAVGKL
jgi:outer membrane protein